MYDIRHYSRCMPFAIIHHLRMMASLAFILNHGYIRHHSPSFHLEEWRIHPTESVMYVPLQINRFHKSILLIVHYKYFKSCSGDFNSPESDPPHKMGILSDSPAFKTVCFNGMRGRRKIHHQKSPVYTQKSPVYTRRYTVWQQRRTPSDGECSHHFILYF